MMISREMNLFSKDKKMRPLVSAELAQDIAADFLLMKVGNLLMAGEPSLLQKDMNGRPCWKVPILLGNVQGGLLGRVGKLLVDTSTGEVLFTDEDREQISSQGVGTICGHTRTNEN